MVAQPTTNTVQGTYEAIVASVEAEDCDTFATYFTDRLDIGEEECLEAIDIYTNYDPPPIDWETTNANVGEDEAKVYMEGTRTLTTFVKEDGMWKADTIYWR